LPRPVWRLIVDGRVDGALNMAIDRTLLAGRADGTAPPTLRLYRWRRPTVTLGRFQPESQVDLAACGRRGFDVARRPTGGRGVLHDDELTYGVTAAVADGVPRGVTASYRHLCAALARAYQLLGVAAELTARPRGEKAAGACYLHATAADLSLGAAKLSGSAQVWKDDAVLQHGSFVISRDAVAESEVFRLGASQAIALRKGTATLAGSLDVAPSPEDVADAVRSSFAEVLGIDLEPGRLTEGEERRAHALAPQHTIPTR
jgi:lipoate-protein ligase A